MEQNGRRTITPCSPCDRVSAKREAFMKRQIQRRHPFVLRLEQVKKSISSFLTASSATPSALRPCRGGPRTSASGARYRAGGSMTKNQKRKAEHAPEAVRDERGGAYEVDPAFAKEGQGEYGGH